MPVIVPPEAFDLWLDCTNVDARTAEALIRPAPEGLLEAYAVSTAVNRTANDDAEAGGASRRKGEPGGETGRARAEANTCPRQAPPRTTAGSGVLLLVRLITPSPD